MTDHAEDYVPTVEEMRTEYTPSIGKVRRIFSYYGVKGELTQETFENAAAQFDRWRAAHDAEVVAKALTDAYSLPCDAECSAFNEGPQEECSRHGRTPAELWSIIDKLRGLQDAADALLERTYEEN